MIHKFDSMAWAAVVALAFWALRAVTFIFDEPPPPRRSVTKVLLLGPCYVILGAVLAHIFGRPFAIWLTSIVSHWADGLSVDPVAAGAVIAILTVLLLNEAADWMVRLLKKKGQKLEREI